MFVLFIETKNLKSFSDQQDKSLFYRIIQVNKFLLVCSWFYLQDKAKKMNFFKVTKLYDDCCEYKVHKKAEAKSLLT